MSTTRRQFLLSTAGASVGAIMPDYYFRALQFIEQFGEPLLEPPMRQGKELIAYTLGDEPELCFGNPDRDIPRLTFREFFNRYEPVGIETFEEHWGYGLEALDSPMEEEYMWDHWFMHSGPSAQAHSYLQSLDLGPRLAAPNAVGGLDFFEDSNMVSCWRGVHYENDVTLSLLQQRLNDLGTGIKVIKC